MNPLESHALQNLFARRRTRYVAAVLTGLVFVLVFPLFDWTLLVWIALAPLLLAVMHEPRVGHGFLLGYLAGGIFFAGNCHWIVSVMEGYGGLGAAVSFGVLALFAGLFAVFFGFFGWIECATALRSRAWALVLSPFLWVSLELARAYMFTGFPWDLLGYAVRPAGLEQIASVTAVYGLSFLAAATAALVALALLNPRRMAVWALTGIWCLALVATNHLLQPPPRGPEPQAAVLLQPNIPLNGPGLNSWAPWRDPKPLENLIQMSVTASLDAHTRSGESPLIVWPEDAAPFYYNRDPVFRGAIETMAQKAHAYVIAGTVNFAGPGFTKPLNSAVVLDPSGRLLLQYDKIHLVPFGEYVPWWAFPGIIGKITSQVGDFVPGSRVRVAETPEGKIGVFICYEEIFPELVRRFARDGAKVLINISDDAWYGNSGAAFQHFEMARFRAIENHRFVLRDTNDGITAIIDPYGRVEQEIPRHSVSVLIGKFNYLSGETFFTAHGDVFAWVAVVIAAGILVAVFAGGRKQERNS
jgi:apolipoprotein N-acyltransferase